MQEKLALIKNASLEALCTEKDLSVCLVSRWEVSKLILYFCLLSNVISAQIQMFNYKINFASKSQFDYKC